MLLVVVASLPAAHAERVRLVAALAEGPRSLPDLTCNTQHSALASRAAKQSPYNSIAPMVAAPHALEEGDYFLRQCREYGPKLQSGKGNSWASFRFARTPRPVPCTAPVTARGDGRHGDGG